ncbi:MAG: AAA family ATPase [Kiritimatiellae bacterium]|nr:AAA family ATPase [Kiritimatiellia bacterium]
MIIKKIQLKNYTVFDNQTMEFGPGINVLIGENGTGKTHVMKALYSACQSIERKISFPQKLVATMLPDDYMLSRLVTRKAGNRRASVHIWAGDNGAQSEKKLSATFHGKTKKWDAQVTGEAGWETAFPGTSSVFIPAKEILSHSCNLNAAAEKNNVRFDDTYLDIINAAKVDISVGRNSTDKDTILKRIETIIGGTVFYDVNRDEFYLRAGNSKQEFNLVAEGIRKMALLWQLVKNGTLVKGSIFFWDEPEANIHPRCIPIIVTLLLELQARGVQIFISTHDYMMASYFDVKKAQFEKSSVLYHSLSRGGSDDELHYSTSPKFGDLKNNEIISAYNSLLDEIYEL